MKDVYALPIKSLLVSKVHKFNHFYLLPPIDIGLNDADGVIEDRLKDRFSVLYDNIKNNINPRSLENTSLIFFEYKTIDYDKFNYSYFGDPKNKIITRTTIASGSSEKLNNFDTNKDMYGSLDTEIILNVTSKQNTKSVFLELEKYCERLNYLLFFHFPFTQCFSIPVIGINNLNQLTFFHLYNKNEFYASKVESCYSNSCVLLFNQFYKEEELLTELIFNNNRNEVESLVYRALINYYSVLKTSDYNSAFMILLITFELLHSPDHYTSFKNARHFIINIAFPNESEETKNKYSEFLKKSYTEVRTKIYHLGEDLFTYFDNDINTVVTLIEDLIFILKNFIIESLKLNITSLEDLYRKGR